MGNKYEISMNVMCCMLNKIFIWPECLAYTKCKLLKNFKTFKVKKNVQLMFDVIFIIHIDTQYEQAKKKKNCRART